jgi:hypothetical protein
MIQWYWEYCLSHYDILIYVVVLIEDLKCVLLYHYHMPYSLFHVWTSPAALVTSATFWYCLSSIFCSVDNTFWLFVLSPECCRTCWIIFCLSAGKSTSFRIWPKAAALGNLLHLLLFSGLLLRLAHLHFSGILDTYLILLRYAHNTSLML